MFVKSFFWLQDEQANPQLVVQRYEATGLNTIMYSSQFKAKDMAVYDSYVKDFYVKENYLFTTKNNTKTVSEYFQKHNSKQYKRNFGRENLNCTYPTNWERNCNAFLPVLNWT